MMRIAQVAVTAAILVMSVLCGRLQQQVDRQTRRGSAVGG